MRQWAELNGGFKNIDLTLTYIGQTDGDDRVESIAADEVVCGFGGNDTVSTNHGVCLGGDGDDRIDFNGLPGGPNGELGILATFCGDAGNDTVSTNDGYFYGGPGNGTVDTGIGRFLYPNNECGVGDRPE